MFNQSGPRGLEERVRQGAGLVLGNSDSSKTLVCADSEMYDGKAKGGLGTMQTEILI